MNELHSDEIPLSVDLTHFKVSALFSQMRGENGNAYRPKFKNVNGNEGDVSV